MDLYSMIQAGGHYEFHGHWRGSCPVRRTIIEKTIAIRDAELAMAPKDETYLTTDEVIAKFHVCKTTLWTWEKNGYLIPSRWGKRKTYALSELHETNEGTRRSVCRILLLRRTSWQIRSERIQEL